LNTSLFHADGPNGSFHMEALTETLNNTTLVGTFEGLNGNAPQIRFSEAGGNTFTDIGRDANQNFVIETDHPPRLAITNAGLVGIGTTTPGFPLEVARNGDAQIAVRSTSVNGRVYTIQSSDGGAGTGNGSFQIIDRTAGLDRLLISKDGNVGMG